MATQEVGEFLLHQKGVFVCESEFIFTYNGTTATSQKTDKEYDGKDYYIHPEDLNVPDGATVKLKVCVTAGADQTADEEFIFRKGNSTIAVYTISGTTFKPKLTYNGLKS